jgi:3-hydroxybutyryl-CoA dehydratase
MIEQGKTIDQLEIGQKASMGKTITEADVATFARISGDVNPIHLDAEYAAKSIFKERVAHGILTSGLISAVIGNQLPGVGTIYLSQNLKFMAPVKLGDTIEAEVEVVEKLEEKNRVRLKTVCRNPTGQVVIDGEALVMPPKSV